MNDTCSMSHFCIRLLYEKLETVVRRNEKKNQTVLFVSLTLYLCEIASKSFIAMCDYLNSFEYFPCSNDQTIYDFHRKRCFQ